MRTVESSDADLALVADVGQDVGVAVADQSASLRLQPTTSEPVDEEVLGDAAADARPRPGDERDRAIGPVAPAPFQTTAADRLEQAVGELRRAPPTVRKGLLACENARSSVRVTTTPRSSSRRCSTVQVSVTSANESSGPSSP